MRHVYYHLTTICLLLIAVFSSCSDSEDVRPNVDRFLRLQHTSITINVGEEYLLKASVDTLAGKNYQLVWSVGNSSLASIEKSDQQMGLIRGLQPGTTTIKVETDDHKLMYFADLTVLEGAPSLKLLTIGSGLANQSANEALVQMAKAAGHPMVVCNIFEDKASLSKHLRNIANNANAYDYKRIDETLNANNQRNQSLRDVVNNENWDYIAIEESADSAGFQKGYKEVLPELIKQLKEWSTNPNLKILIHQPWAYSSTATTPGFKQFDNDQLKMFNSIVTATQSATNQVTRIVPVGTAIQNARTTYLGESVINGDIELNATSGQYIAAMTWIEVLFGIDVSASPLMIPQMSEYVNNLYKLSAHNAIIHSKQVIDMVDFKSANPFILDHPIYIDFGEKATPLPFNSFIDPEKPVSNLIDKAGNSTYFNIEATSAFGKLNRREISNTLGFPESVCQDMFFRDGRKPGQGIGSFKVSNMNTTKKYTFVFYGAINDKNTGTRFKVRGVNEGQMDLSNDYNKDKLAIIENIQPRQDGTVDIELTMAPFNTQWGGFFGVNAMIIVPEGYSGSY